MHVALVNPPALSGKAVFRDGYCSSSSKSGYLWHPLDLLVQSGLLTARGHELTFIDAVADRQGPEVVLERVAVARPDVVLGLAGDVSWPADVRFYRRLSARLPNARLVLSGDVPRFESDKAFGELPGLDAVMTDFSQPGFADWLDGERGHLTGLQRRDAPSEGPDTSAAPRPRQWTSGPARHDLLGRNYRLPFHGGLPFASVLASYGCPYSCTFCNTGELGYRGRDTGEVIAELKAVQRLGYRRVYLRDATANGKRAALLELCRAWERADLGLAWNVFCTFSPFDADLAGAMARAGCRVVQFGIEAGDDAIRSSNGKAFRNDAATAAVRYAHEAGMQVCGHFVLGLPGQDEGGVRRTLAFARELDLDFASFNLAAARPGTALRREADARGLPGGDASGDGFIAGLSDIAPERLRALKRSGTLGFYLRPRPLRAVLPDLRQPDGWAHLVAMGRAFVRTW